MQYYSGSNGDKDMHDSIPNQVDLSEVKESNKENQTDPDSGKYKTHFAPDVLGENQEILDENEAMAEMIEQSQPVVGDEADDGDDEDDEDDDDDDGGDDASSESDCCCCCSCDESSESDESDNPQELDSTSPTTEVTTQANSSFQPNQAINKTQSP